MGTSKLTTRPPVELTLQQTIFQSRGKQKYSHFLHATDTRISCSLMDYLACSCPFQANANKISMKPPGISTFYEWWIVFLYKHVPVIP